MSETLTNKTRAELVELCKTHKVKNYTKLNKPELIQKLIAEIPAINPIIPPEPSTNLQDQQQDVIVPNQDLTTGETIAAKKTKKSRGQFYTTNANYIMSGMPLPPNNGTVSCIIEPFAGQGDLLDWITATGIQIPVQSYDIDPKRTGIQQRDTLRNPPNYDRAWIITNPPYLARNKATDKTIYDQYNTNDLYKAFILSICQQNNCAGGILLIPAGFFFSPRDIDIRCRQAFLSRFKITKIKYFEETVFADTTTTIIAMAFEKSLVELVEQSVLWERRPSGEQKVFTLAARDNWIIGGQIYGLPVPDGISIRRFVAGETTIRQGEQQTFMTLTALDSGTAEGGRISLNYSAGQIYQAKDCSRTYATMIISGRTLSELEQKEMCRQFNEFIEARRSETWSLFLPQYRESKEYARKRMPFELAYQVLLYIIGRHFGLLPVPAVPQQQQLQGALLPVQQN